jgi:hypothetical protein
LRSSKPKACSSEGLPFDQSRVAYLRYLRRERRQSPRSEADADHVAVKTEMLQLRLIEKTEIEGLPSDGRQARRAAAGRSMTA